MAHISLSTGRDPEAFRSGAENRGHSSRRSSSPDHAKIAKTDFLAGLGLFAVGVVGESAGRSLVSSLSETIESALLTAEILGVIVFFVPVVFGAVLPLVEQSYCRL